MLIRTIVIVVRIQYWQNMKINIKSSTFDFQILNTIFGNKKRETFRAKTASKPDMEMTLILHVIKLASLGLVCITHSSRYQKNTTACFNIAKRNIVCCVLTSGLSFVEEKEGGKGRKFY